MASERFGGGGGAFFGVGVFDCGGGLNTWGGETHFIGDVFGDITDCRIGFGGAAGAIRATSG